MGAAAATHDSVDRGIYRGGCPAPPADHALEGVDLIDVHLEDTDLSDAEGLTQAQIDPATCLTANF
jgi:hypothetical protein